MMSLLGVVLYLLGHRALIFPAALSGGISSALSMAGGEWLSDSGSGLGVSCVMGLATGVGAILPAVPYLAGTGPGAIAASVAICLVIGTIVAFLRARNRRPGTQQWPIIVITFGILAVIFAAVFVCGLFLPGGIA
jgi:VIT1/CCC1 family predicted Fe2+/Mn2+ transporter